MGCYEREFSTIINIKIKSPIQLNRVETQKYKKDGQWRSPSLDPASCMSASIERH